MLWFLKAIYKYKIVAKYHICNNQSINMWQKVFSFENLHLSTSPLPHCWNELNCSYSLVETTTLRRRVPWYYILLTFCYFCHVLTLIVFLYRPDHRCIRIQKCFLSLFRTHVCKRSYSYSNYVAVTLSRVGYENYEEPCGWFGWLRCKKYRWVEV